ncbi:MAG: hypothetical protein ACRDRC_08540, partial [Pseudonocardiaceae bacterium]
MTRINITETNELTGRIELIGWFDPDKATEHTEDTDWDGSNNVSKATGRSGYHQRLYRTAGGRWVLCDWSHWQGTGRSYEFVGDVRAREWLLLNDHNDVVARHFGRVEDERGPGRPEVGGRVDVRLGDLTAGVDAYATEHDVSRAEAIRRLLAWALSTA